MKRALTAALIAAALAGCAGEPVPAEDEGAAVEASGWPAERTPEPGFDPDDPALTTIPDDGAHGERIVRAAGKRSDFKVPAKAVAGLEPGPLVRAVVTRPFYELDSEVAADRLNPAQLAVYAIYLADFEILNGGFSQFWLNAGALGPELVPAAERVGSAELAAIFREAEAVWPGGKVPRDRAKREALLDQLDGERLAAVDERYAATQYQRKTALANVLGPYIRGNTRQFVIG
ncbi:uncharacterized protein DUF4375 [Solirubrobacter pauli]|uniref:Uncharacterized protein DUF4375 n=1 Tax=Solirubrobacter pauli TaxID=166793 RepID=A0A660LCB7_9ACTN|nr:DUF4375 domain-containing protein [Solirubrobacter pauli]RKQ91885.1 uncharacterized protein DUF4375 [Solirubrobacter pauli]